MQTTNGRLMGLSMFGQSKNLFRTGTKTAIIARLIVQFFAEALVIKARVKNPSDRLKRYHRNASKYSGLALKVMNIKVDAKGFNAERLEQKPYLLVCNHMSYIDALIAASVLPCAFVTSVDMGEQAFLGDMAELGGSIFVERRNRDRVDQDLSSMAKALEDGVNVMIYPEGTSTNGGTVLPFKKSLLMSAVAAKVDIQPVVIRYTHVDGEKFGPKNCDSICWYGKMDFASHLLRVLSLKHGIKAELEFLEPISVRPDSTRNELAEKSYAVISEAYLGSRTLA